MAIKNFLSLLIVLSFFLQTSCQSARRRGDAPVGSRPDIGPRSSEIEEQEPDTEVPVEVPARAPKKVAVILGPGGAKALAHVGVLKAFHQQRIPIDKIVGLEWGALVAGLYASKGQIHDVEWKLYKMEQQKIFEPKGFFSRGSYEHGLNEINGFLKEAFSSLEISRSKVPFACPIRSIWTGVVSWQTKGAYRDILKRCLSFPPTFKVQGTFVAGASQATEAVEMLVEEGYNVIILVNALGSAMPVPQDRLRENLNHVILWQEIKRSLSETSRLNIDTVNVDTSAFPVVQYGAKKELILLGEKAGATAAAGLIRKYGF